MHSRWKRSPLLLLTVCVALMALVGSEAATQESHCQATTTIGSIQGIDGGGACIFLGIPFAAPPVGNLRWKPPRAAPSRTTPLNAVIAPASCPQINLAGALVGSEDCLKLNVWTPDPMPAGRAPVIVWLHTGGFLQTSANFAAHNGQRLAEQTGAIIVAPNYRLGPFGYLAHTLLSAEDDAYPSSGNYGFLDQRAALVWVRDHIAAFGGDPDSVTIAGTSAGSLSVSLHLVSPGSAGLFSRAIMQSGFASYLWRSSAEATSQGNDFMAALGCASAPDPMVCLRGRGRDDVLRALPTGQDQVVETARVQWGPVVDGLEIPDQPRLLYERGAFTTVPVLLGTNRDEGWPFVDRSFPTGLSAAQYETALSNEFGADAAAVLGVYPAEGFVSPKHALARLVGDVEYVCEARRVAQLLERRKTPVFLYSFDYEVDDVAPDLVIHGLETNLVFGTNYGAPSNHVLNAGDVSLFDRVSRYWTRFAATGDPNVDDPTSQRWPAFTHPAGPGRGADKYIVLDTNVSEARRPRERQCDFWEGSFLRSTTGVLPAAR